MRKIDRWGRRRFAYEIARQTEGYYVVVRFNAEPATAAELDRTLKIADEIVRHKVLVVPEKKDKPQSTRQLPPPRREPYASRCGTTSRWGVAMANDNQVTVIGNLTDDPELRYTANGAAVCKFRMP